jgi:NAD(P)-dependent dehydrogenase (short-subunit alcohol dehydrogenase family)
VALLSRPLGRAATSPSITVAGDVTDLDRAAAVVSDAHERLHGLSVPVNNVGNVFRSLDELTFDDWEDLIKSLEEPDRSVALRSPLE